MGRDALTPVSVLDEGSFNIKILRMKLGIDNPGYMMILLLLIDVVVIICCAYLLINRTKVKS
jgi:hypothetical protein